MTTLPAASLETALGAVLDRLEAEAPVAAARGRRSLMQALAWVSDTDWADVACLFSPLADGLPVELVWRPGEPGLFWTAEPAAPEWTPDARLERALALAENSGERFTAADRALLARLVDVAPSPWALWLAGRHRGSSDSAKVYVLLSAETGAATERLAPLLPALRDGDLPVMLGIEPDGALELYWRRTVRRPGDRYRVAQIPGADIAVERLEHALREWTGAGLDDPVACRLGLSLRLAPDRRVVAAAAFVRASAVAPAATLRRRLLDAGGARNPALSQLWSERCLRPLLLTLAASATDLRPALGFTFDVRARAREADADA